MTFLILAGVMGFLVGNNYAVEKMVRGFVGAGYANQKLAMLSVLGGFGGWYCILPASIILATTRHYSIIDSIFFIVASLLGAFVAGLPVLGTGLRYLLSPLTLPLNICFVACTFLFFT